jgi:hypothetical protein
MRSTHRAAPVSTDAGDVDPTLGTLHPDVVHRFLAPDTGSEPAAHPGHVEGRIASAQRRPPSWTR